MAFTPGNENAFKPGHSGNPGGRPKVIAEIRDLAREHTALALETLATIAKSGKSEAAQVSAAIALLDRGWGKPTQPIGDDWKDDPLAEATAKERQAAAVRMIRDIFATVAVAEAP